MISKVSSRKKQTNIINFKERKLSKIGKTICEKFGISQEYFNSVCKEIESRSDNMTLEEIENYVELAVMIRKYYNIGK